MHKIGNDFEDIGNEEQKSINLASRPALQSKEHSVHSIAIGGDDAMMNAAVDSKNLTNAETSTLLVDH